MNLSIQNANKEQGTTKNLDKVVTPKSEERLTNLTHRDRTERAKARYIPREAGDGMRYL